MKKMRFSEKQNDVTITTPEDGVVDVIILTNETVVTEKNEQSESDEEVTYYEYDGNIILPFTKSHFFHAAFLLVFLLIISLHFCFVSNATVLLQ